jgi:hypothetical protein
MIVVPAGTRLPLVLHNAVSTRNAHPGDPIYLETTFPIVQDDKILVPAGSYVQGEVTEAVRPGRVKGTGEIGVYILTWAESPVSRAKASESAALLANEREFNRSKTHRRFARYRSMYATPLMMVLP